MALTATTLAAAVAASDTRIKLTSTTSMAAGDFIKVNSEFMLVDRVVASGVVDVRQRGFFGTQAKAHNNAAPVVFGQINDLNLAGLEGPDGYQKPWEIKTIHADGAITTPTRNTRVYITKGSICAITLSNPSEALDGVDLEIVSTTAFAHTVTYTAGFHDNTTTSDVATFAATKGATFKLVAQGGRWRPVGMYSTTVAPVTFA